MKQNQENNSQAKSGFFRKMMFGKMSALCLFISTGIFAFGPTSVQAEPQEFAMNSYDMRSGGYDGFKTFGSPFTDSEKKLVMSEYDMRSGGYDGFKTFRFRLVDSEVESFEKVNMNSLSNEGTGETVNGLSFGLGSWVDSVNGMAMGMVVGGQEVNGVSMSFVSILEDIQGVSFTGYGAGARTLTGLGIGLMGYEVTEDMTGALFSLGVNQTGESMTGVSIGGIGNIAKNVTGIQIGLFNKAENLNGIQLGLLNYAGNNPVGLQILPGINAHFSF